MFSWPNARVSVMGGDEAASVLTQINQAKGEAELATLEAETRAKYECESSAWYATARLWDDGVIDPAETRVVLGLCLRVVRDAPPATGHGRYGIFRM